MFDVEMCLQKLYAMDPCDVAEMLKSALDDAGVEYTNEGTDILFDGLFAYEQAPVFCSTSFADGRMSSSRKAYSYIGATEVNSGVLPVRGDYTANDFEASDYALAA